MDFAKESSRRGFLRTARDLALAGIASQVLPGRVEAGGEPDVHPFIIDDAGQILEVPTAVFAKVVHSPQFVFGFYLNRADYFEEVRRRMNEIRGFAVKGRPEMLKQSPLVLAEDNPQNQIPIEVTLEDKRLLIKAKNPEGFPAGSQVSVTLPISPDPLLRYVMRTFTEETETKEKTIKTPAIVGVVYLEKGRAGDLWNGRFTDLYPQFLGEPGIKGITVRLDKAVDPKDLIGEFVAETKTNENGVYVFEGLVPGRYRASPRLFSGQPRIQGNFEVVIAPETQIAFGLLVGIKPEDLPVDLVPRPHKLLLPTLP